MDEDIQEIKLWEWCKTHGDYAGYLMHYPDGRYASEARALLKSDDEQNQSIDNSIDWNYAFSSYNKQNQSSEKLIGREQEEHFNANFSESTGAKHNQVENKKHLKHTPWQLVLSCICNILAIIIVITGLVFNKIDIAGFSLLGLGLVELMVYFILPSEKRILVKGYYLFYSGVLTLIGGIVFSFI